MAPDIRLQYGPMLLGVFMNMILYGVLILQTYHYYLTYPKDKIWIKFLVLYLFIVESVNTGCDMYIIYQPLIERFGLPEATKYFPTLFAAEPITIVAVSTPIQLFLAWRVWLFTKSKILPVIISIFSLVSLAGGIWTTYGVIHVRLFIRKPELHTPALIWFLTACAADVLITVVLVIALNKKKTGFVATDDVISKIIRMTVQTGLLTTVFALGDVIFFMTLPHTALNFIWDLALSKLYTNCLLSTLNARLSLQGSTKSSLDHHSAPRHNPVAIPSRRNDFSMDPMPLARGPAYPHNTTSSGGSVQHFIRSYDVEIGKPFDRDPDVGYGITITKVIERKDDRSGSLDHTQ
jgi:hypothetical protein